LGVWNFAGGHAALVVGEDDLDAVGEEAEVTRVSLDSPTTTRGIWKSRMAPVHIWHGDSVVYRVVSW
jgi:hypothetical protein